MPCIARYIWVVPRCDYIALTVQRQQIDVLIWVGHTHIVGSKHELLNKRRRSTQNHNCSSNKLQPDETLQHRHAPNCALRGREDKSSYCMASSAITVEFVCTTIQAARERGRTVTLPTSNCPIYAALGTRKTAKCNLRDQHSDTQLVLCIGLRPRAELTMGHSNWPMIMCPHGLDPQPDFSKEFG